MNQDLYLHGLIGGGTPTEEPLWTRPTDWLAIPTMEVTDDKIYLLVRISENTVENRVAFTVAGNYTVDWGDGNTENVTSDVKAEHQYDFTDISIGTLDSSNHRQALVTITPNASQITSFILDTIEQNVIQIDLNCPNITDIVLNSSATLVFCNFYKTNVTDFSYMFTNCTNLKYVGVLDTSSGTDFSRMFNVCYSLLTFEAFDSSLGTNFSYMCYECRSLGEFPLLDTSSGTNFAEMMSDCYNLKSFPLIDLSQGLDVSWLFASCYSLSSIPELNISSATTVYGMFAWCYSLSSIPLLDTSACTSFQSMFRDCTNLTSIPALDLSLGTSTSSIFGNNQSIREINWTGLKVDCTITNSLLDRANIVNVFNNLASGVVGQSITVSGNPGTASLTADDLLIATSKGWTVTT